VLFILGLFLGTLVGVLAAGLMAAAAASDGATPGVHLVEIPRPAGERLEAPLAAVAQFHRENAPGQDNVHELWSHLAGGQ
jgi:hypothetical protein